MYSSDRMNTVIGMRYFSIFICEESRSFWFSYVILLNSLPKCIHDQSLLDYFWDIIRDWQILQRTTTLHGRLYMHMPINRHTNKQTNKVKAYRCQWLGSLCHNVKVKQTNFVSLLDLYKTLFIHIVSQCIIDYW